MVIAGVLISACAWSTTIRLHSRFDVEVVKDDQSSRLRWGERVVRALLAALLLTALGVGSARADWYRAETRHFIIIADERPDRIAARAKALERYDRALRIFHHIPDPDVAPVNRVTVFVVRSVAAIEALGVPGAAGFYRPVASRPVAFTPERGESDPRGTINRTPEAYQLDPESVLRHEYAHHFMFNSWSAQAAPLWFTEGFAEFHATAMTGSDGSITFGQIPFYRGDNFLYWHGCDENRILTTSDLSKLPPCGVSDIYAYGWLTMDYLLLEEGGRAKLGAYLKAINEGQPLSKAAEVFGDLNAFEKRLVARLNARKLPAFTVVAADLKVAEPTVRKLTPGEAATIQVRIRSNAGVTKEDAESVYRQAERAAAPYPDDAGAQLALAEAAFDAKHYDATEAAARRAIAADPKASKAMLYLGRAKIEEARAAKARDAAAWTEARRWFLAANRVDPDDAEPLVDYFTSFVIAGQAPTANAKAGLLQAANIAPQDSDLFLIVTYAYLRDNEPGLARDSLRALAYYPHSNGASVARALMAMIDRGDIAAARAKLEARIRDPEAAAEEDKKKPDGQLR